MTKFLVTAIIALAFSVGAMAQDGGTAAPAPAPAVDQAPPAPEAGKMDKKAGKKAGKMHKKGGKHKKDKAS